MKCVGLEAARGLFAKVRRDGSSVFQSANLSSRAGLAGGLVVGREI